jgi:putative resolvase
MEGEHLSIKEARKLTGVTTQTLRNWAIKNKVRFSETPTGRKLYNKQDILSIINMPKLQLQKEKRKIAYCRVSSKKQSDDLERQKEFFRCEYPEYHLVEDIGSGINWNRKGLKTILEQAMSGTIGEVMVAHRDRLCRFAFELIEFIFEKNGVKLTVLDSDTTKSKSESNIDNELSEDIMSIVHVYSCRQMGRRRYKKSEKDDNKIKETSNLSK